MTVTDETIVPIGVFSDSAPKERGLDGVSTASGDASRGELFLAASRSLLASGITVRFTAHGNSMKPFIRDGDILLAAGMEEGSAVRGGIVLYRSERGDMRVHRVLGVTHGVSVRVRGDAIRGKAEVIPAADIFGVIIEVIRDGIECRAWRLRWLGVTWHFVTRFSWPLVSGVMYATRFLRRRDDR